MAILLFIPLILLFSVNNGFITTILSNKVPVFLGEISYGIYILQLPVFIWCSKLLTHFHISNLSVRFYTSAIVLILFSSASYVYIETPFRNYVKCRSRKRV